MGPFLNRIPFFNICSEPMEQMIVSLFQVWIVYYVPGFISLLPPLSTYHLLCLYVSLPTINYELNPLYCLYIFTTYYLPPPLSTVFMPLCFYILISLCLYTTFQPRVFLHDDALMNCGELGKEMFIIEAGQVIMDYTLYTIILCIISIPIPLLLLFNPPFLCYTYIFNPYPYPYYYY
jgi:hypothetical protein